MKKILSGTAIALLAISLVACDSKKDKETVTDPTETASQSDWKNDPYLWLEEVEGKQALDWVNSRNRESLAVLTGDKRFEAFQARSLELYNAKDKIAYGSISGDDVHNLWRDEKNVRGVWRKTSLNSYNSSTEEWETILDFDALATAEKENWVYKGRDCLAGTDRCLIRLSRGGTDAVEIREFDKASKTFVDDGFKSPESKQWSAWKDKDTLLIATNFGEGTMNTSGYPRQVREWKRGTDLSTATLLLEIPETEIFAFPSASHRPDGTYVGVVQGPTFFTQKHHVVIDGTLKELQLSDQVDSQGYFKDQIVLMMRKDWTIGSKTVKAGTLVSVKVTDAANNQTENSLTTLYAPEAGSSIDRVVVGKDRILISLLDNVKGKLISLNATDAGWAETTVDLPANGTVGISAYDSWSDRGFINFESFLQPDSVYFLDTDASMKVVKSLPARFDASDFVSEQKFATSKDGTKIPYFVVYHKDTKMDGSNPTLQYAYGGFEISIKPSYLGGMNLQWLENGGVYVSANIRGGGEYGPSWHQSVLKEKRQGAFDDFIAVSEALIEAGITSPKHLAARGGSNGGLLMGAVMTQRPDLYQGVIVAVPLLDMMRYHKLLAGASWVGEYGNPDVEEERDYILKYSPYQNLDETKDYPEAFFYTSTKDDRVHPGHARKMAAKMLGMDKAVLYYENTEGGHAAASNLKQRAKMDALQLVYLSQKLKP